MSSSELRLALAMRGGVSLAVWMGGACCETARLREAAPDAADPPTAPVTPVYRELLDCCGYRTVGIDVLAGTSAGGLNGVLLACHLVYGMPFGDGVRDVWLRLGDVEGLLRRRQLFQVPDSLMRGDEVFYGELREALRTLIEKAPEGHRPVDSLRLILTATRLRPRRDWVRPTLGRPLLVGRSNAYFRFRHRGGFTDFPPDGEARKAALDRLAYAARTTSSFPGAFEPGRLFVGNETPQPVEDPPRVNMRGVSSETGYPDENQDGCAEFIDGGLLDNIPVAWAVRAIAGVPVTRKVDRWLLFLQPVPPLPPEPEPIGRRRVTRLVSIATKSLAVKSGAESLRDDALELRDADAATQLKQGIAGVLPSKFATLRGAARDREDPNPRTVRYPRTVGLAEATRLIRLLTDPADVTGPDPLPLPCGPGPLEPLDEGRGEASALFAQLRDCAERLVPTPKSSPLALARAVRLLMDWLWAYEDSGAAHGHAQRVADCRELLYAHRLAVATLIAARDRMLLDAYRNSLADGGIPTDPIRPLATANGRLRDALPAVPLAGAEVTAWHRWSVDLAAEVAQPPWPSTAVDASEPLYDDLWDRLAALGRHIGRVLQPPPAGYTALGEAALLGKAAMLEALLAAEVLLGPLRPDPLAEATDIKFHTISAANGSWATDRVLGRGRTPEVMVEAKLSGNQLSNFAAFLSVRWRLGDWTWGRLDAAASLVAVAATDERLAAKFGNVRGHPALGQRVAAEMHLGPRFTEYWNQDLENEPDRDRWDRVRYVLTAVRQREILDEELPLIAAMHKDGIVSGNRPQEIPARTPNLDLNAPEVFDGAVESFAQIGAEGVNQLVRAPDPRRAALRTGLVAWPAIQPSGRLWARPVRVLLDTVAPLFWLPTLAALLAPATALIAFVLMWIGVAFASDHWSSLLAHIPLCCYAMIALGAGIRQQSGLGWLRVPLYLLVLGPPVALWQLRGLHPTDDTSPWERTLVVAAAFAIAAAALLYLGSNRWCQVPCASLAAGLIAGLVVGVLQHLGGEPGGWWGALVLYAVLAWTSWILPWLYPRPWRGRRQPDAAPSAEPSARVNR
ncbi:DUF3376 domain-containing protein [Streptomyces sp. NPDC060028]|uniref:DUF3376 domain-containing protein n=1 Tax=Streptomyces sp. NPDC060028 TaxID=3347041 RepID=UPI0036BFE830